jgi:RNA 3'-terminal phosphate cyclase
MMMLSAITRESAEFCVAKCAQLVNAWARERILLSTIASTTVRVRHVRRRKYELGIRNISGSRQPDNLQS